MLATGTFLSFWRNAGMQTFSPFSNSEIVLCIMFQKWNSKTMNSTKRPTFRLAQIESMCRRQIYLIP